MSQKTHTIRSQLTQTIPLLAPEIYDEIIPNTKGIRLNYQNMFKNELDNS